MAHRFLGHLAKISGYEIARRGVRGEGEGLMWSNREVQTAGSSSSKGCFWSEVPPSLTRKKSYGLRVRAEAKY